MSIKTVLFCRVSSKEQEETGYSLPAQEKLLQSYAEKHAFEINKVFSISESASGQKQRETFRQMMAYVEKHSIKIIVCEKVDRLTRNFKDAVMIDEWLEQDEERQVHLVKDSLVLHKNSRSQEKLNWGIRILFAKNYIDNLSEEVKKGQKEKISQGWYPTRPPLGYTTIGEKGHKIHILDTERAPLIKRMFELYASGNYSIKYLTEHIHKEGLRSGSGNKVVKSLVHRILTDVFYIGKFEWLGTIYPGKHEPLISNDLFTAVQRLLRSKNTPKYSKHNYLYKALIRCKECGGLITWETAKGHIYGHCNHYRKCKQITWVKEYEVDEQIVIGFEALKLMSPRLIEWVRKALKESHKDQIQFRTAQIVELQKRQEQLRLRLDHLYEDKVDGSITQEFYTAKHQAWSQELEEVSSKLSGQDAANLKSYEMGMSIYDLSQRADELYKKASMEQKQQLLRLVYEKVTLDEGELEYAYTKPFELLAKAVKQTNSSKVAKILQNDDGIFEPSKCTVRTPQMQILTVETNPLLPREDSNLQPSS